MHLVLFHSLNNLDYYGYIPKIPKYNLEQVEIFKLFPADYELFRDDIDSLDTACDAILDLGDVEYFNAEKCEKLRKWVGGRLEKPVSARYREILETLKVFCDRAIEFDTGVVIEL